MQELFKRKLKLVASIIGTALIVSGVLAGVAIVINDNNRLEFGVGTAPVNPCDPDVTVNIIVDRFNEDQYLTGFEYSFVDKPACVGYDIETRMVTDNDQVSNLFATTSLASDPTVIRVFSTSSVSNWQLGKGAFSGVEATVTQLSQSSFRVTFTTPVLLASNLGKILTAEIPHLPLGTFTGTARSITGTNNNWVGISTDKTASSFYIAEGGFTSSSGFVYKSTQAFSSYSTSSLQRIDALPNGSDGYGWSWLSQSESGQYVAAVGGNRRTFFSKDYGNTWDSITITSSPSTSPYYTRASDTSVAASISNSNVDISADGSIVCLISRASSGSTINIWTNYRFYSKSNSDFKLDSIGFSNTVRDCKISADNNYIFILTSNNLYRVTVSSLAAGPVSLSNGLITPESPQNYFRVGVSATGKYVVYGRLFFISGTGNVARWRYSSDFGATFSESSGVLINQDQWGVGQIAVSRDGANVAAAVSSNLSGANAGGIYTSNDFGKTFMTSSVASRSIYSLAASADGTRIIGGTQFNNPNLIYFLASD